MNPLLATYAALAVFIVSFVAWFLAGQRTLCVMRLERRKACLIVWLEDLLPFVGIAGFLLVETPFEKAIVAVAGATGSSLGLWTAMTVEKARKAQMKEAL
jgi:uncharacterized protein YebE (UPF0316 family)